MKKRTSGNVQPFIPITLASADDISHQTRTASQDRQPFTPTITLVSSGENPKTFAAVESPRSRNWCCC